MVKILHTGDMHLDSAFAGLTGEQAIERRGEQRRLLRDIVELGNEEGVELILLSGDLLDGMNAYYETADALSQILAKSSARVFIAPGNHDAYHAMSPYRSVKLPENVHLFKTGDIEDVDIPEFNVCVHGAAFTSADCESSLLRNFRAKDDGRIHIMVLHGEVTQGYSKYNPIREEDIAASNLDYLALGHVHSFGGVQRAGKTAYAYCGCPEGRGFDELGDKGVIIGSISREGADVSFRKMARYTYNIVNIRLGGESDAIGVASELLPERDERGLYRAVFDGECEDFDAERIYEEFAPRFYYFKVIDRTAPIRSIWEGEELDGLKGMFLRRLHKKYLDTGDAREQEIIRRAARFGVAALDNREEPR